MRKRQIKGVHQPFTEARAGGEHFVTCACGAQWHDRDPQTVWALFWQHVRDPAHR